MKTTNLLSALAMSALIALTATNAFAQVGRIEGQVVKEGTTEPVPDVEVVIERTDIKGTYKASVDKKGHFLHAGVPYSGTYVILFSAPGQQPYFLTGIKPSGESLKVEMRAGDGRKLTLDEVKKLQASAPTSGGGGGGQKQLSAADQKKAQEEMAKEMAAREKAKSEHENMKKYFEQGMALSKEKKYDEAITAYNEAAKLDPEQLAIWGNLALTLHNRGITSLNNKSNDAAKQDFTEAINAVNKALELIEKDAADPKKSATVKPNKATYTKMRADSESLLAKRLGAPELAEAANKDYLAAGELSDNPADKKSYAIRGAETLREAGKNDEAAAAFKTILETDPDNIDALYNLGLVYSNTEKTWQDAANALQKFVDKAPENDPRVTDAKSVIGYLIQGNNIVAPKAEPKKGGGGAKKKP
ncbi:MAG TPA: tetratricopeptide repeat protein [Blastocatellia bacterium]|nr:tetratricopeptide repeat protein [Blastocatellia bacterium]